MNKRGQILLVNLTFGTTGCVYEQAQGRLRTAEGHHIQLTSAEQRLLLGLIAQPGFTASYRQLETALGCDAPRGGATVMVCVSRLRAKLRAAGAGDAILTVKQIGYRLVEETEQDHAANL